MHPTFPDGATLNTLLAYGRCTDVTHVHAGGRFSSSKFGGLGRVSEEKSASASHAGVVGKFGLEPGDVVGEMGYDDDVDDGLRLELEQLTGSELVDEDADEVVDAMLLWWREDDGDLTDALVDALTPLADDGTVLVVTPKTGLDGYVEPSDIADAGRTAGLSQVTNLGSVEGWMITRLSRARAVRAKR